MIDVLTAKELMKLLLDEMKNSITDQLPPYSELPSWAVQGPYSALDRDSGRTYYGLVYVFLTPDERERLARSRDLRPYVRGYAQPPANAALQLLLAQSYMRLSEQDLSFLSPLVKIVESKIMSEDGKAFRDTHSIFKEYVRPVMDILEMFGSVLYHIDYISERVVGFYDAMIKVHFYGFTYSCKAMLDFLAVFLNRRYLLGFKKGDIDLKNERFLDALQAKNLKLARKLRELHGWIKEVANYRDNIIHRHGVYIPADSAAQTYLVPKMADFDPFFDMRLEPEELARRYMPVMAFCNDWREKAEAVMKTVLADAFEKLSNSL